MSWTEEEQAAMQVVARLSQEGRLPEFLAAATKDPRGEEDPAHLPIHMVHVLSVPHEAKQRFLVYLRRRLGFSPQEAEKVMGGDGVILTNVSYSEAQDIMPDLETMGVQALIMREGGPDHANPA